MCPLEITMETPDSNKHEIKGAVGGYTSLRHAAPVMLKSSVVFITITFILQPRSVYATFVILFNPIVLSIQSLSRSSTLSSVDI